MKILAGALLLALPLVAACGRSKAAPPPPPPATTSAEPSAVIIESPSMQFLPRQEEVQGWRLQEDPLVFAAKQLPARLGKDATQFLSFDVIDMTVGHYQHTSGPGFATVEIFRYPDFVKAFGAYSSRRKAVRTFLPLGNESFVGPHSIHIWSGPFYVRMIGGGGPIGDPLARLATAVADRMPKAPSKPAIFAFLPETFRVVNSETFSSEPGFGQEEFANAFHARYNVEGEEIEALILPAASRAAAAKILDSHRAFFVANGKLLDPIFNLGEDNFTGEDRFFGRTVAFRIDRFVIAFRGYKERQRLTDLAIATNQRILGTIRRQLETADRAAARAQEGRDETTAPDWTNRRE